MKRENIEIKNRVIRYIRNFFEYEEENYYKPVRDCDFWRNNYIEHGSNRDRNKALLVKEYLNKIRQYLK